LRPADVDGYGEKLREKGWKFDGSGYPLQSLSDVDTGEVRSIGRASIIPRFRVKTKITPASKAWQTTRCSVGLVFTIIDILHRSGLHGYRNDLDVKINSTVICR
jgi:hypothetical protein